MDRAESILSNQLLTISDKYLSYYETIKITNRGNLKSDLMLY